MEEFCNGEHMRMGLLLVVHLAFAVAMAVYRELRLQCQLFLQGME
jgi:hypothetical protein